MLSPLRLLLLLSADPHRDCVDRSSVDVVGTLIDGRYSLAAARLPSSDRTIPFERVESTPDVCSSCSSVASDLFLGYDFRSESKSLVKSSSFGSFGFYNGVYFRISTVETRFRFASSVSTRVFRVYFRSQYTAIPLVTAHQQLHRDMPIIFRSRVVIDSAVIPRRIRSHCNVHGVNGTRLAH